MRAQSRKLVVKAPITAAAAARPLPLHLRFRRRHAPLVALAASAPASGDADDEGVPPPPHVVLGVPADWHRFVRDAAQGVLHVVQQRQQRAGVVPVRCNQAVKGVVGRAVWRVGQAVRPCCFRSAVASRAGTAGYRAGRQI